MKKILSFTLVMSVLLGLSTSLYAQKELKNGLGIAMSMLDNPIVEYEFYYQFETDSYEYHDLTGTMSPDGFITSLKINGTQILYKGETPLPGLPYPEEGLVHDAYISIYGKIKGDGWFGYGYSNYDLLRLGDRIEIVFQSGSQFTIIDIDAESGDMLYIDGKYYGSYSYYYGGFPVWVSLADSYGDHLYKVLDYNGDVVGQGVLDYRYQVTKDDRGSNGIDIKIAGGVEFFNADSSGYFNLSREYEIDGASVNEDGDLEYAKTFVVKGIRAGGSIYIDGDLLDRAVLYEYKDGKVTEIGRMNDYEYGIGVPWYGVSVDLILVVYGEDYSEIEVDFYLGGGKG